MLPELHEGEESELQMINQEPGCLISRPLWQLSRNCHFLSTFLRENTMTCILDQWPLKMASSRSETGRRKKFNGVETDTVLEDFST